MHQKTWQRWICTVDTCSACFVCAKMKTFKNLNGGNLLSSALSVRCPQKQLHSRVWRTGIGNFPFFWWYRNQYRNKLVPEKSLGTGIGQIWYREKVSEPVSEKFGTGKKYRNGYRKVLIPELIFNGYRYRYREFFIFSGGIGKIWYRKKVSEPVTEFFCYRNWFLSAKFRNYEDL